MTSLWNQNTEGDFFSGGLRLATKEKLFYKTDTGRFVAYWPKSYKGEKSTLQSRNAFIGNFTEKWTVELLTEYAKSKGLFAVQGVVCEEIGLSKKSPADVALCRTNNLYQDPSDIAAIIEVKMSVVWNWEYREGNLLNLGDFTTHKGTPGLLRSDSMLKAIGKSINIRVSGYSSGRIPIVIFGNTPIQNSYYKKVDHLKKCGVIQGFWSINPDPRDGVATIKNTDGNGFIRMDTNQELTNHFDNLLNQDLAYFSSMKPKRELGNIILISSKEPTLEKKAEKFLELIRG